MNNKLSRIILFTAAIVVWGLIVYRVVVSFSNDESNQTMTSYNLPVSSSKQMQDTFNLLLNYPDPFLGGGIERKQEKSSRPTTRPIPTEKKEVISTPMPQVKYYGLITNKKTQKLVAIINIAGKQYLAKQGNKINEITLLKMTNDSILINYGQTKKWILK